MNIVVSPDIEETTYSGGVILRRQKVTATFHVHRCDSTFDKFSAMLGRINKWRVQRPGFRALKETLRLDKVDAEALNGYVARVVVEFTHDLTRHLREDGHVGSIGFNRAWEPSQSRFVRCEIHAYAEDVEPSGFSFAWRVK